MPLLIILASLAFFSTSKAQSLSESIQQSKMQEQLYLRQIDSLRKAQARGTTTSEEAPELQGEGIQATALDSLLQGPVDDSLTDTTARKDSLKDSLTKRFSQRIFSKSPGSMFGSYGSALGRSHVLGSGDEILVSLWGDKEKQYRLKLDPAGKAFLEGVGLIPLGGLSIADAESRIRKHLSKIYSGINRGTAHVEVSYGQAGPVKVFVLGEVQNPGGFVFSGNTSILSAFYQAKGPTNIGTVRNVKLTRGSKSYDLDLYEYLLKGNALTPHALQDGDIIFADRAQVLVEIAGDVGRPAVYELKAGEGIRELISYAGELNPTVAQHRISLRRIQANGEIEYLDLANPQEYLSGSATFNLKNGDSLVVEKSSELSDKYVSVVGPVKYPGRYAVKDLPSVAELVKRAGGLHEEAYLGRVHIVRFQPNGSSELFSYSLENTQVESIELKGMDHVILYSKKDMFAPDSVQISGAIFKPGKYLFSRGMTAKDLILSAGGYLPQFEDGRAVIFRIKDNTRKVESIEIKLTKGLESAGDEFTLQARDLLHVPMDPRWYDKEVVTLSGQFKYPGKHSLLYPGEKLVSVIKRAGGIKEDGYVPGFKFFRKENNVGRVGVDLEMAFKKPDSRMNIPMAGGDSLYIPELQNSVKVIGEVGFPTSVLFKKGAGVHYYIKRAGGFTRFSDKKHIVLEYANGETTSDFYKDPNPGSVIYVPNRPEPEPIDWVGGINAIVGTMGAAAALILSVIAINRSL